MENLYKKALKLFEDIDDKLENHYKNKRKQPPCAKGCSSCCSQFFEISELEFSIIFEEIMELEFKKIEDLKARSNIIYNSFKEYYPKFYSEYFLSENIDKNDEDYYNLSERFEVSMPCVFLASDGSCDIYSKRPFTCRSTGVGFTHLINTGAVCEYIKFGLVTPLWQADLREYRNDIEDIRWIESSDDEVGYKRQYPMFYFVYDMFYGKGKEHYKTVLQKYKKA